MRDINLEDTIYPRFTTRAFATGIPTTLAGTPVLSIYEENNLTQITAGVSITVDYDSVTGLNQATIVATAANGYEAGKSYDLVITTGTVGGVSVVGETVYSFTVEDGAIGLNATARANLELQYDTTGLTGDTFPASQSQLGGLTNTGAAVNVAAESYTLTTGTQSANLYTDTAPLDGVRHTHTDDTGAMELYYQFDVTTSGVPTSVSMVGRLNGGNDALGIYAYNWASTSWEQIGSLSGKTGSADEEYNWIFYSSHVGTGANLGKVRVRFYSVSGLTTATLYVDQIYTSYAVIPVSRQTKGAVSDVSPGDTSFDTDLTQVDDLWNDALIIFTSGNLANEAKAISDFANTNGAIIVDEAFTQAPANGDSFIVYHTHIHPVSQIQSGLATEAKQDIIDTNVDQIEVAVITNAAGTDISADVAAVKAETADIVADTNELQTDWTNGGRLDVILDELTAQGDTNEAAIGALNNISVADVLTTQMTEAYAADGTAPTLAQAIFLIQQTIGDFSIAGTTLTAKKLDGSTTAATYTLDDAVTPTSRTRAT